MTAKHFSRGKLNHASTLINFSLLLKLTNAIFKLGSCKQYHALFIRTVLNLTNANFLAKYSKYIFTVTFIYINFRIISKTWLTVRDLTN